jgi:PncC family amidohydrolase
MKKAEAEISRLSAALYQIQGKYLMIGTVESATGGRIADRLTAIAGSSNYFEGSIVSYSNRIKERLAHVKDITIEQYGAVSSQAAVEMAEGGRKSLKVDICVSTTGIAGPGGVTPAKPLGLFYIGLATASGTSTEKHVFSGKREEVKQKASEAALKLIKGHLQVCLDKANGVHLEERHVVTCFLEQGGLILILRRSGKVGTYKRDWAGVSGYLETAPLEQAYTEIREETGLFNNNIRLVKQGRPLEVIDQSISRKWVVHPFLFHVLDPLKIMIDWEHTEFKWIKPGELKTFNTVPGLDRALNSVL